MSLCNVKSVFLFLFYFILILDRDCNCDEKYQLSGIVQIDDIYCGGGSHRWKYRLGSERLSYLLFILILL